MTAVLSFQDAESSGAKRPAMLVGQRSRHRIRQFRLHRPETAEEAVAVHAASTGPAAYMAGGIDLIAALKTGAPLRDLIHLDKLPGRMSITERDDCILIGAGATHQVVANSRAVCANYPGLCEAWSRLANNRIRNKGTVGGNLMARNPAYDFPIVAMAACAKLQFLDSNFAVRELAVQRLADVPSGALLTSIALPRAKCVGFVVQLAWKPIVAFALSFQREQEELIGRLAVGCGYPTPAESTQRFDRGVVERGSRETPADITEQLCGSLPAPGTDWRASSEYRSHLLRVLVRREIERMRATEPALET